MVPSRRSVIAAGLSATLLPSLPALAQAQQRIGAGSGLGGLGLDASTLGLHPGSPDDQSERLRRALAEAARRSAPLLLPPGRYRVADVALPDGTQLLGVPGATRLVTATGEPILTARQARRLSLSGLSLDGRDIPSPNRSGLIALEGVGALSLSELGFEQAGSTGLVLTRCSGQIQRCRFSRMRDAGLFSLDSLGLTIADNTVEDCGNNGLLIWRSERGDDGSILRGNRIARIRAEGGGDGPNGNGIGLFRAGGVIVEGNQLRDCAMTFIRNNSGSGVQMLGNQGRRCGEVGVYSEFAFEGSIMANNLIEDCAAGASITNLDHGGRLAVFANNIIRNVRRAVAPNGKEPIGGFGVQVEAEATVTGNVIENVSESGIVLGWAWAMRNLSATGNIVRKTGIGISVSLIGKERNALIANNVIDGARGGAVVGTEYGKPVTGDLTKAPDPRASGIRVEGNAVS